MICVKMTTPLKVTLWHHIYSNIINSTQQYFKRYTKIYRLLYSVLDIAGREILLHTVLHIVGQDFYPFFCHMAAYYSSTCTNDWLEMVVWCYFKKCCHFNAPRIVHILLFSFVTIYTLHNITYGFVYIETMDSCNVVRLKILFFSQSN